MSIFPNCDFIVCCFAENLLYLMNGIPWLFMFQWITPWLLKISVSPGPVYILGWLGDAVLPHHSEYVWGVVERKTESEGEGEKEKEDTYTPPFPRPTTLWPAHLAGQGSTGLRLIIPCAPSSLPFQLSEREKTIRGSLLPLSEAPDPFPAGLPKCG